MLGTIADVNIESGPSQIDRFNRLRNINFNIEPNNQPLVILLKLTNLNHETHHQQLNVPILVMLGHARVILQALVWRC